MSTDFRLPTHSVPRAYTLTIEPDLTALTFRGDVTINLDVKQATPDVTLHAANLEILEATLGSEKLQTRLDAARERLTLIPKNGLPPGPCSIAIRFNGVLSEEMRGFYRSAYTRADGTKAFLGTTQFESTSARRCFPCFDEPSLRATFDLTVVVPGGRQAISNMPVVSESPLPDGRRRVRFGRTPSMSTYLLAIAVGEFDSIEGKTKDGLPVRVFATPGKAELGRFALDTAIRGLEFFGGYYGIPYGKALPKLDLLAIPDFEYGAMENWGAVTFRETAIFVDPKKSSVPQRRRVAEVVLHEEAHQWFGNLVTPEWWSYLWLNESFATFMAYKAVHALFPEWDIWEEYLSAITSAGRSLDSLRTSHPVEVAVKDPNEVDQIFDAISYNKGGSVLRMLEDAIGEEAFCKGVRGYLERHAYGCATTDDLWSALGDVSSMMDGWTRQTGLPVVRIRAAGGELKLRQERFLLDRDPARPSEEPTLWDIPLSFLDASGQRRSVRLSTRESSAKAPASPWIKANAGHAGFYLTNYDEAGWQALAKAVSAAALGPLDRYGLQEDAYSLMRAGYLSVPSYLRFLSAYASDENHHVWGGVADGFATLSDIFVGDAHVQKLEAWARELYRPVAAKVGWEEPAGEATGRVLLRATILGAVVRFGEPDAIREVRTRFDLLRKDLTAVSPNLRSLVFWGAARNGDETTLDALCELYEKAELPEVKVQLLRAMGAFRNPGPLRRAVQFALSEKVRRQDAMAVFGGIPIESKATGWALLQEHWAVLDERYGKSGLIGRFISGAASGIPSEAHAADVEKFFKDHPAPFATETIKQLLEGIRARAKFRERNKNALAEFFKA